MEPGLNNVAMIALMLSRHVLCKWLIHSAGIMRGGIMTGSLISECYNTMMAGLAAGSELVIGPWSHGGLVDQSVAEDSSFDQPKHSMAFINRCCDRTPSHAHASQPAQASHQAHPQQQSSSIVAGAPQLNEGSAGFVQARTADPQTSSRGQCTSNKEAEDAALPSVHFFMMGAEERGWKASHSWPPSNASSPPLKLFLNKAPAPVSKPSRSWFRSGRKSAKVANREDSASQVLQQSMPRRVLWELHTCSLKLYIYAHSKGPAANHKWPCCLVFHLIHASCTV